MSWAAFDPSVVSDRKLGSLKTTAGKHRLIALKVWMTLLFAVDFVTRDSSQRMLSLTQLAENTGLRKPTVLKGIRVLEECGWIRVVRSRAGNAYTVLDLPATPPAKRTFTKVPSIAKSFLRSVGSRGRIVDAALALYVVLLKYRVTGSPRAHPGLTHVQLRELTGVQPNEVRAGLDVLINHGMIHVLEAEDPSDWIVKNGVRRRPQNIYLLKGAFNDLSTPKPTVVQI